MGAMVNMVLLGIKRISTWKPWKSNHPCINLPFVPWYVYGVPLPFVVWKHPLTPRYQAISGGIDWYNAVVVLYPVGVWHLGVWKVELPHGDLHVVSWLGNQTWCKSSYLSGGNSVIFYVHPEPYGNDPCWLIFFKWGWLQPPTRNVW